MTYDDLLIEADKEGLNVREKPLSDYDGRIKGCRVAIRKNIPTTIEKSCVLAEELGHYYTTTGNILDQSNTMNRKQEYHARLWAYNKQIGLIGLIKAFEHGCQSRYEVAKYLDVPESFLDEAIKTYTAKYGTYITVDSYVINFLPTLSVTKLMN